MIETLAPAGILFEGEARSTKGGLVGGSPRGDSGGPGRRRNFEKVFKKSMKNLQFFKKISREFRDFSKFF